MTNLSSVKLRNNARTRKYGAMKLGLGGGGGGGGGGGSCALLCLAKIIVQNHCKNLQDDSSKQSEIDMIIKAVLLYIVQAIDLSRDHFQFTRLYPWHLLYRNSKRKRQWCTEKDFVLLWARATHLFNRQRDSVKAGFWTSIWTMN